ncbi:hypothetical protein V6Z11_A08G097500 [Gossypium hirsutum]
MANFHEQLLELRALINSVREMVDRSLESSRDEIFASYLSGRVAITFSTILASLNCSPRSLMLFTTAIILSEYCLTVSSSFILRFSKSLLKLRSCCCLVLSVP